MISMRDGERQKHFGTPPSNTPAKRTHVPREALEQIHLIASDIDWPDEGREIAKLAQAALKPIAQNALSTGKDNEPLRAA
jgi:hypothetical protein